DKSTVTALSFGFTSAMRSRQDASASWAEIARSRIAPAMHAALHRQMSSDVSTRLRDGSIPANLPRRRFFGLIDVCRVEPASEAPGIHCSRKTSMGLIAVGGFQHETNTFAPSKADYAAFEHGGGWPPLTYGAAIAPRLSGSNIPAAGAIESLHSMGHRTVGLVWGAASP